MKVELWAIQPGPADKATLVERAARLCYDSPMAISQAEQIKFLANLSKRGHASPAEHARWVWLQSNNPYHDYWRVRYGTNITERKGGFVCSMNGRSVTEHLVLTPARLKDCLLQYTDLSDSEKLAHASATFEISGISRACSHQLVRHRVFSFSQRSQRYCEEDDWTAIEPQSISENDDALMEFDSAQIHVWQRYQALRELGIPKEDARFVLPNATPTKLVMTGTFGHWLHFIGLRTHKAAQWEIRSVADEIQRQLREVEPGLFG